MVTETGQAQRSVSTRAIRVPINDFKLLSIISVLLFLGLWQFVTTIGWIDQLFLPSPSSVVHRAYVMWQQGSFLTHILASARRVLVGFALASLVAVPLGILLGTSPAAKALCDPFLSILRPLPSMSWIPLSLLWLGITEEQKYSIVFMGSFASSVLYTVEATRSIDPILIRAAKNLGASPLAVMREVILPGALPSIIAGLRVMLGISWTCVISAELVAAREGLGFLIMNGKEYFLTDQVLLGMTLISITVIAIDAVFVRAERRIIPWRE